MKLNKNTQLVLTLLTHFGISNLFLFVYLFILSSAENFCHVKWAPGTNSGEAQRGEKCGFS